MRAHIYSTVLVLLVMGVTRCAGQAFTVGTNGFTVKSGTSVFIDSLALTPSVDLTITSNTLTHSSAAVSVNGVSSILNQFTFSTPITYSGNAAIGYTAGQLNGNPASELVIAYNGATGGTYLLNCLSTADTTNAKVNSSSLSGITLYNLTAVKSSVSVAPITGAGSMNVGATTTLANVIPGGTWNSYNTSLATVSTAGLVSALAGGTDTIAYVVSNTCNTATAIKVMNINSSSLWIGVSNTNWADSSNWSTGIVPTSGVNATVPYGTPYSPQVISGAYSVKDLSLASGGIVTLNSGTSLSIKGDLNNNGTFSGAGTLKMDAGYAQSIDGTGHIRNFELNNAAGASIASDALQTIDSLLTVNSGTLTTGDSLVLNSDSLVTARIAPLPATGAYISGNIKTMQYVQGGYRRYRFWSHPFSSYVPLSQVQNYIDVTGQGGAVNGFTGTGTNAPSAFRYNPLVGNSSLASDPGWKPFTSAYGNADTNRLKQYQGIRLFVRGAKGEGLGYDTYTPSATTIGMWGAPNQGNQVVTLSKGSGANQDYNMVGNPYASPVDIGTVIYNASVAGNIAGSAFYIWNPSLGAAGQFQAIFIGTSSAIPYYLPAYCAFQVRAAHNGDSLNFSESHKAAQATTTLFRTQPGYLSLAVYDENYHPWDMLHIRFSDDATSAEDFKHDATKPSGAEFNFYSLSADSQKLVVDARPYIANTSIPLGISSPYAKKFIIRADNVAVPDGGLVYLHDKLLKQYVLLSPGMEYGYTITGDNETQGDNRFELSLKPTGVVTAQNNGLSATVFPNPTSDEVSISYTTTNSLPVKITIVSAAGAVVYNQEACITGSYCKKINLDKWAAGVYMVEVSSGANKVVQKLVKQ